MVCNLNALPYLDHPDSVAIFLVQLLDTLMMCKVILNIIWEQPGSCIDVCMRCDAMCMWYGHGSIYMCVWFFVVPAQCLVLFSASMHAESCVYIAVSFLVSGSDVSISRTY